MTLEALIEPSNTATTPIIALRAAELPQWLATQSAAIQQWVEASAFSAEDQATLRLPGERGAVLVGLGREAHRWSFAALPSGLPPGDYSLDSRIDGGLAMHAALGWALGAYRFTRYKSAPRTPARLCWPAAADRKAVTRAARAIHLCRDLINTPAADLGPAELGEIARELTQEFGGTCECIVGDALLAQNYPLIHAVGRASARPPRLIDIKWGDPSAPRVTLIGKGVCFDTGGLNLKQGGKMLVMKLDMGGAAHALALARMIMEARLPVRLRVLIPAVENAIAGNALRPLDIIRSRAGLTVEVADTDAEGRLILADALAEACNDHPALLIDFATLTSSARVALGPDITAMFTNNDSLAAEMQQAGAATQDPVWHLPLWRPYARDLQGKLADLTNVADLNLGPTTMAGAIYAALFLDRFVTDDIPWMHLDIFGWNLRARPGRPEGGEAHALLAAYEMVRRRFEPVASP